MNGFDLDEQRSRGRVLEIKSPFRPKEPTPVDHYVAPEDPAIIAWKAASLARAKYIADAVVAQLPPERAAAVAQLATAQRAANAALNDARARLAELNAAAPADVADIEVMAQQEGLRVALARHMPALEARSHAANQALGDAITETRSDLEVLGYRTAFKAVQREMGAIDDQIEALTQQRADLERALHDARGMVNTWGSTGYYPPIQAAPAPEPEAPAVPRRWFERKTA